MTTGNLRYRSLAGDIWPAERLSRRNLVNESCWDIEVVPPIGDRLELRAIPHVGADTGARGICFFEGGDLIGQQA
jgi:hypothetical protein